MSSVFKWTPVSVRIGFRFKQPKSVQVLRKIKVIYFRQPEVRAPRNFLLFSFSYSQHVQVGAYRWCLKVVRWLLPQKAHICLPGGSRKKWVRKSQRIVYKCPFLKVSQQVSTVTSN